MGADFRPVQIFVGQHTQMIDVSFCNFASDVTGGHLAEHDWVAATGIAADLAAFWRGCDFAASF